MECTCNSKTHLLGRCPVCIHAATVSDSAGFELLTDKVKALSKELDREHHRAETEYLQTDSQFEYGRTMELAKVCSKLMLILN